MIRSMTGFGRGEYSDEKRSFTVEVRSVNHRYCDIFVRMPRRFSFAEESVKKIAKEYVHRGKVEIGISEEDIAADDTEIRLNDQLARQYIEKLALLKKEHGLSGEITLDLIASMPDVLKAAPGVSDEEEITAAICRATRDAMEAHASMRETEGEKLRADLDMRGDRVLGCVGLIKERAPEIQKEYARGMRDRINEILEGEVEVPEDRVLLEAAVFADKASITEELVRLDSHVAQLHSILAGGGTVGKKLDFLVQEMNREANTIGSKANDLFITKQMLEMKAEVEKIREQVQNIE
ncbi:MAG: YicC/YloC family endoribonuclease [Anaerovoracaceae bacterium]|nr:YicC/YloC family endoribonuclease [Anaerovoracaceae bacterium]